MRYKEQGILESHDCQRYKKQESNKKKIIRNVYLSNLLLSSKHFIYHQISPVKFHVRQMKSKEISSVKDKELHFNCFWLVNNVPMAITHTNTRTHRHKHKYAPTQRDAHIFTLTQPKPVTTQFTFSELCLCPSL